MPNGSFEWEEAKRVLATLIYSGELPESMGPRDVYNIPQHKKLFHQVKYENFRTNLNSLRKKLKKDYDNSVFDQQAFEHDRALNPIQQRELRWPGSAAELALKKDVKEGKHKTMTPAQLRQTNEAYMEWPLHRFRDHIYQEQKRLIESPYWARYREEKQKKKDEQRRKRMEKARRISQQSKEC